jgi:hypothetical protein
MGGGATRRPCASRAPSVGFCSTQDKDPPSLAIHIEPRGLKVGASKKYRTAVSSKRLGPSLMALNKGMFFEIPLL